MPIGRSLEVVIEPRASVQQLREVEVRLPKEAWGEIRAEAERICEATKGMSGGFSTQWELLCKRVAQEAGLPVYALCADLGPDRDSRWRVLALVTAPEDDVKGESDDA